MFPHLYFFFNPLNISSILCTLNQTFCDYTLYKNSTVIMALEITRLSAIYNNFVSIDLHTQYNDDNSHIRLPFTFEHCKYSLHQQKIQTSSFPLGRFTGTSCPCSRLSPAFADCTGIGLDDAPLIYIIFSVSSSAGKKKIKANVFLYKTRDKIGGDKIDTL